MTASITRQDADPEAQGHRRVDARQGSPRDADLPDKK